MDNRNMAALVGDFYHPPEAMIAALEAAAGVLALHLEVFTDPARLPWDSLDGFQALVVAREGKIAPRESDAVWNTDRHEKAISAFVRGGGALVALHAGLASYTHSAPYVRTTHGSFCFHPSEHPEFRLRAVATRHPILEGFDEFDLRDEMYFVRVDAAETTRLLEVTSPDYGSSSAAWAHSMGAGRVFCFTPGHRNEVLEHPGYRRLLQRGIRWAVGGL